MIKKLFSLTILTFLLLLFTFSSHAQENVIPNKVYYKSEFIDDKATNSKEYIAWALDGTPYTSAMWRIVRITYDITNPLTFVIEWADGDREFNNVLSNYATLSYS